MNYKLSPSDLTFLYEGCKRCFYLKVVKKISQPSIPLPSIFSKIAGLLKDYYTGKNTKELHADLPPGIVSYGEKFVESEVIQLPGCTSTCFISGRFDIVISFEDGTYGVIDFKTGNPNDRYVDFYSRQLHAYAYALEHPAPGKLSLSPITKLGLLYFYPSEVNQTNVESISYKAEITWKEIEKNEQGFLEFIDEVLEILDSPEAPDPSLDCQWCKYSSRFCEGEVI